MRSDQIDIQKIKATLKEEHGLTLSEQEAGLALQNLTDFFALLYQYDLDDRQKLSLVKGEGNGQRV